MPDFASHYQAQDHAHHSDLLGLFAIDDDCPVEGRAEALELMFSIIPLKQ